MKGQVTSVHILDRESRKWKFHVCYFEEQQITSCGQKAVSWTQCGGGLGCVWEGPGQLRPTDYGKTLVFLLRDMESHRGFWVAEELDPIYILETSPWSLCGRIDRQGAGMEGNARKFSLPHSEGVWYLGQVSGSGGARDWANCVTLTSVLDVRQKGNNGSGKRPRFKVWASGKMMMPFTKMRNPGKVQDLGTPGILL